MTIDLEHTPTPELEEQEPTAESLKEVLTGLPLIRQPNYLRNEWCKRCEQKNDVRRQYDIPEEFGGFMDGERVRLTCLYDPDPEECKGWAVTSAYHLEHDMKPADEVAAPELAQARVTARLGEEGWTYHPFSPEHDPDPYTVDDRSVVSEVEVEWFSPIGEGEERPPPREPDEHGMIELKPTDPRPDWPEEDNEWREKIMREHGDWNDDVDDGILFI